MRASQYFIFMNSKNLPTPDEQKFYYTHLKITEELKAERRKYRAKLRKHTKDTELKSQLF